MGQNQIVGIRLSHTILLLAFSVLLAGCVSEVGHFNTRKEILVIDGSITNQRKEHIVKVYRTTGFNKRSIYLPEAQVRIVDDLGNVETLTHYRYDFFKTSEDFAGVVGRYYHLEVIIDEENHYTTAPTQLLLPPEIDAMRYSLGPNVVNIYADFQDPEGEDNFYRWRYDGVYEVVAPLAGPPVRRCWVNDFDIEWLNVMSDEFVDGRALENVFVAPLEYDRRLEYGYNLVIRLQRLSKEAYEYWQAIENQLNNNGTIFETANYQIRGSAYNVDDPDELVLGVFQVSGQTEKTVFIYDYTGNFGPINCEGNPDPPSRCFNCLKIGTNGTNIKPDYWPR